MIRFSPQSLKSFFVSAGFYIYPRHVPLLIWLCLSGFSCWLCPPVGRNSPSIHQSTESEQRLNFSSWKNRMGRVRGKEKLREGKSESGIWQLGIWEIALVSHPVPGLPQGQNAKWVLSQDQLPIPTPSVPCSRHLSPVKGRQPVPKRGPNPGPHRFQDIDCFLCPSRFRNFCLW